MNLQTWYKGLTIPDFDSPIHLQNFAISMMSTFAITSGGHLNVRPSFHLTRDIDTAAIDLDQNKVMISSKIISKVKAERHNPDASVEEAICTILGMIFHESMHFVKTSRNLEAIIKNFAPKDEQLFLLVSNVLEDYYIDHEFMNTMPMYQWTYDARFRYFFATSKAQENFEDLKEQPTKANMVKFLISMKNPAARYLMKRLTPEFATIAKLAFTVLDEHDREKRPLIAHEVYKLLLEELEESTSEQIAEAGKDNGDSIVTTEEIEKMESDREITTDLQICVGSGDYNEVTIEVVPSPSCVVADGRGAFIDESTARVFSPDTRYNEFTKLLKARSETSHLWTPPSHTGRSVRHVSRIAIDNKIFSTKVVEQGIGPQEVILLMDCSASMYNEGNIYKTLEAGYATAMSLEAGRHNIAVYGHTADHHAVRKFASNIIYRFKAFDEKFESVKQRFMYAYRATEDILWNNDDEMAIAEVSTRFTSQKNTKTLIVISDGSPSSYRSPSIRSTRAVVQKVRSKGIKVISISISENAAESNDKIYGKEWNVSNDDPNVVMDVIRKIAHF